jgi:EEF1A lysine methyltransferase 4
MPKDLVRDLSHAKYWDARYIAEIEGVTDEESYEWLRTFDKLRPFLRHNLPSPSTEPRLLHLGCGISSLAADLSNLGFLHQSNVDFSPVAIDTMKARYGDLKPGIEWHVMDIRNMEYDSNSFDAALDKSTLDAMLSGGSLWTPPPEVAQNIARYVDEVARVLKPGGKWLCISFNQPHFLTPLLRREAAWEIRVEVLQDAPGSFEYFGFVMTKHS